MDDDGTGLEDVVNRISDMDAEWWPFLFLRPEIDEPMTNGRVALLAVLYGGFVGMLANLALALTHRAQSIHVAVFPAAATVTLFIAFRTIVAHFWNRRAERLAPRAPRTTRES